MAVLLREAIGDRLRHARTNKDRTLREIARAARVSLGYLSEVERGRKEASSELLASICEALDLPLDELLTNVAADVSALSSVEVALPERQTQAAGPASGQATGSGGSDSSAGSEPVASTVLTRPASGTRSGVAATMNLAAGVPWEGDQLNPSGFGNELTDFPLTSGMPVLGGALGRGLPAATIVAA